MENSPDINNKNQINGAQVHWKKQINQSDNIQEKLTEENINYVFAEDKTKFIGEFECEDYKIIRGYLNGQAQCLRLYYTKFEPHQDKRASICIVHGFGEYSGRFLDMAEFFVKNGLVVHLIDLRGFGYSGGPRCSSTIQQMHQDIETLLKQVSRDLPLFLYGHSLGGCLLISICLRNPSLNIAGVILTSPLIKMIKDRKFPIIKSIVTKLLGDKLEDIVANAMINITALSKNNHQIRKCFGDRLMAPFLGLNMAKSILHATDYIMPNAQQFKYPLLIVHGQKDLITGWIDSQEFYNKCGSQDKEIKLFPDGYHELQHDDECQELKNCCIEFLNKNLSFSTPFGIMPSSLNTGVPMNTFTNFQKVIFCIIFCVIYFINILRLRGSPKYQTSLSLIFFPIFYLIRCLK